MAGRWLRLRAVLNEQFSTVVVGLLILALLGGWMSYTTHVAAGATAEHRTETLWESTGEFSHSAVVEDDRSPFETGTQLTDRPIYYTQVSPQLNGTFRTAYTGPQGDLQRSVSVVLLIRAVDRAQSDREESVYWETSVPLNTTTVDSISPEESVSTAVTYDMRTLDGRISRIHDQLGSDVGETEVVIRATVRSEGRIGGTAVDETSRYTFPVELTDGTYSIDATGPQTKAYETTRTEHVESTPQPAWSLAGPGLLLVSLCGLGGLGVSRRRGTVGLSEPERERLEYQAKRTEFDDWISPIRLPEEALELPQGEADSLTALVDLAIDTNTSVIEDPDREAFYVRHDGYLYTYRPAVQASDSAGQPTETDSHTSSSTDETAVPSDETETTETETDDSPDGRQNPG